MSLSAGNVPGICISGLPPEALSTAFAEGCETEFADPKFAEVGTASAIGPFGRRAGSGGDAHFEDFDVPTPAAGGDLSSSPSQGSSIASF